MRRVGWIMPISGGMRVGWGGLARRTLIKRVLGHLILRHGIDLHTCAANRSAGTIQQAWRIVFQLNLAVLRLQTKLHRRQQSQVGQAELMRRA